MNPELYKTFASDAAAAVDAGELNDPAIQRNLSLAILRARPNCCRVCDAMLPMQEALFRALEQAPAPPAPPPAAGFDESFETPSLTH